jgi:hypothetical protein
LGFTGTTKPIGSGGIKWEEIDLAPLAGARVIVLPDHDAPGTKYALGFLEAIGTLADVRIVHLPGLSDAEDVSDWAEGGGTAEQLEEFVAGNGASPDEERSKIIVPIFAPPLVFHTVAELIDIVANRPAPKFLASPIWPQDAYGVLGAEMKAGKTWLVSDLLVATASGGAWLGKFPIERQGPVVAFLGEGGDRKMVRRLEAVAKFYGVELRSLPIVLCMRAPHLSDGQDLQVVANKLDEVRPVLVVVDPLYLAARGAQASQLYEMGAVLEGIQTLCQDVDAALLASHHHNRQKGQGIARLSGAGPAEWGRVIVSAEVKTSHTDEVTKETAVVLELVFVGDEIPETTLTIRRRVMAVDPDDLASPLVYSVETLPNTYSDSSSKEGDGFRPSERRVLAVLNAVRGEWLNRMQIGDALAVDNTGFACLTARTIQTAAKALTERGLVEARGSAGEAFLWRVSESEEAKNDL